MCVKVFVGVLATLSITLGSMGCGGTPSAGALAPDVVFHNGKIATVNAQFETVEALAVRAGRIVAVGSNESVRPLAADGTRLVDLEGKTVLPGFHDSHVHLGMGAAEDPRVVDMWAAQSVDEILAAITGKVAELPEGEWIIVDVPYTSQFPHVFPEAGLPTLSDFDGVAPNHPVWFRRGVYLNVLNSVALREAGINRQTETMGGVIDRDENGQLNGILRGRIAHLVGRAVPPSPVGPQVVDVSASSIDSEIAREGLRRYLEELLTLGITNANAAGIPVPLSLQLPLIQDVYDQWGDQLPRLVIQPRLMPGYDQYEDLETGVARTIELLEAMPFHTGFGNDRLKMGAIKFSMDGAFSGPDAWTLEPYPGQPDYYGTARTPAAALYPVAKRAHELGWQLGVHAIGDAAIQEYIDVLDRIFTESPRADARPYVHHFTMLPPAETLEKMARLGVIVSSQPNWTYSKMQFIDQVLSGEALARAEPQQSIIDNGIRLAYGSDGMPHGPLLGIDSAVTRIGGDGTTVYGPEERVTLEQAIRSYTMETAYMNFNDEDQGSLEVGKWADMVVLSNDIFAVPPDQIRHISVEQTIVAGEVLYSATEPKPPFQNINHPFQDWPWINAGETSSP
jgi:predicted amidohydrolase YtcJ